ncbi:MAG: ParB/RepB/Spo0J family partition protein [Bacteroidales bacterium]|jgi:ParB family chromosome partitioning protein|nr:ParB/RepB/Spo0J family partition protein [Bacteroidales bacterium]
MTSKNNKGLGRGLGRGLDSLIPGAGQEKALQPEGASHLTSVRELDLEQISPNPFQPRSEFDRERLQELTDSISRMGVIQPITVKKVSIGRYQIISGERRYRASKAAGLKTIPAYVKDADENSMLEMALVENIQREDLDPIDIAISFQRLIEECNLTQEALSPRVGKNRATIANYLRLLKLQPEIQLAVKSGAISMGHAKALLGVEDANTQKRIVDSIVADELSVRQTEDLVRKLSSPKTEKTTKATFKPGQAAVSAGEVLGRFFNGKVTVKAKEKGGEVILKYRDEDQIASFLKVLKEHNLQ